MRKRGFTLIELLVVIAILSLLVSILLPALARAKNVARAVVCGTNTKSIGRALGMYALANNGWIPCPLSPSPNDPDHDPSTYPFYGDTWNYILSPDHKNIYGWQPNAVYCEREVFNCLADPDAKTRGIGFYGSTTGFGSYGLNDTICAGDYWGSDQGGTDSFYSSGGSKQGVTTYAYGYMMYLNGQYTRVNRSSQFRMWAAHSPEKTYMAGDSVSCGLYRNTTPDFSLSPRHRVSPNSLGSANMLFFDTHVELLRWEDIPMREWTWMLPPWFNTQ